MTIEEALRKMNETTRRCEQEINQQREQFIREISKADANLIEIETQQQGRIKELEAKYPVKAVGLSPLDSFLADWEAKIQKHLDDFRKASY